MVRFVVASLLVAVAFAAAAEARDVHPANGGDKVHASRMWVGRKLLAGEDGPVFVYGARAINASISSAYKLPAGEDRPVFSASAVNASISSAYKLHRRLLGVGNANNAGDECQHICDQVKFRAMCRSLTRLPSVTTPRELLQAAVRVARSKAQLAKRRVDAYAAGYHGGNPLASILETCSQGYGNVADSLVETQRLIDRHASNGELNQQLSGVTTDALDCSNAFDERPEIASPFPGTVRNVYRLTSNVLDIAYAIKQV